MRGERYIMEREMSRVTRQEQQKLKLKRYDIERRIDTEGEMRGREMMEKEVRAEERERKMREEH